MEKFPNIVSIKNVLKAILLELLSITTPIMYYAGPSRCKDIQESSTVPTVNVWCTSTTAMWTDIVICELNGTLNKMLQLAMPKLQNFPEYFWELNFLLRFYIKCFAVSL